MEWRIDSNHIRVIVEYGPGVAAGGEGTKREFRSDEAAEAFVAGLMAVPVASGREDVHRVTDAQIADIVLRWEANQFDSFSAMRAIKQHLEKCALQPANDYNLGWVAGHRAAPQPPVGASMSERARDEPNPPLPRNYHSDGLDRTSAGEPNIHSSSTGPKGSGQ